MLEAFYSATGGGQWEDESGWMSAASLSEWEGVEVDATGLITHLNMCSNKLCGIALISYSNGDNMNAGNIPAELSQLRCLEELYLDDNNLSGKLCEAISDAINHDIKAGSIPAELFQLTCLKDLILDSNYLSGKLGVAIAEAAAVIMI